MVPTQVSPDGRFLLLFAHIGQKTGVDIFVLPLQGERKVIPIVQGPATSASPITVVFNWAAGLAKR